MNIQQMQIKDIIPFERNAKKHDERQIKNVMESKRQYGIVQPLVVDKENVLIIGHCRLIASKRLKLKEVPVVRMDELTQEQVDKLRLLDNKLNESEWDFDILLEDIPTLDFSDFDLDWELPELDEHEDIEIVEDEVPEEVDNKTELGDIWLLGNHRLICGDSTDTAVIEKLMDGRKADLLITDPPYNVDYEGGTKDKLKIINDKMEDSKFRQFLTDALTAGDNVMRAGAVFYIWHADSEGYNFRGACIDVGWKVRECLIWNKNAMVMGRQDYQWKHEPCLYGWKDGASHLWASDRKQTTVIDFNKPLKNADHPTMKPVGLFGYQISNNTHEGDAVLDMFGGSGTTLIASEQLKRTSYLCELDPHYVDVIVKRYINLKGADNDVFVIRNGEKIPFKDVE